MKLLVQKAIWRNNLETLPPPLTQLRRHKKERERRRRRNANGKTTHERGDFLLLCAKAIIMTPLLYYGLSEAESMRNFDNFPFGARTGGLGWNPKTEPDPCPVSPFASLCIQLIPG